MIRGVVVVQSLGSEELFDAVEATRRWVYEPAVRHGERVGVPAEQLDWGEDY